MPIFYVYLYLSADGRPYYVGKGCRKRYKHPHTDVPVPPKDRIVFAVENTTEEWALFIERRLIDHYGKQNDGTGILENKTDGGQGTSGAKLPPNTEKHKECIRRATAKRMEDPEWVSMFKEACAGNNKGAHRSEEMREKIRKTLTKGKVWKFRDPNGKEVIFEGSLNKFSIDNSLNTGAMSQVHLGNVRHHKGWTKL